MLNPIFPLLDPIAYNDLPQSDAGKIDLDKVLYSMQGRHVSQSPLPFTLSGYWTFPSLSYNGL